MQQLNKLIDAPIDEQINLNQDKNTLTNITKLWAAHAEEHDVTDLLSANTMGNIFGNEK